MTLVRVSGSPPESEVRMTTWYGEQSGTHSWLHSQPKNPVNSRLKSYSPLTLFVTFLRISQLFPPVSPIPGDLAEPTVEPEAECDGNDPDGIEEEDARRHKYLVKYI